MTGRPIPEQADVVVAGGGTAGLATALAFAQKGRSVCVLERRDDGAWPRRGEIIQPNGLAALAALGVLPELEKRAPGRVVHYHFRRIGKGSLVSFDYRELPHPHPYTLVVLPETVQQVLAESAAAVPHLTRHTGARVTGVIRDGATVTGVTGRTGDAPFTVRAKLVVGADGTGSAVRRATGVCSPVPYHEGYLTGMIPNPAAGFADEGYYYVGKGEILGLFPVSEHLLYFFYMMATDRVAAARDRGTRWLVERIGAIHPQAAEAAKTLTSWNDLDFFPCTRLIAPRWFAPGVALVGNAAHGVNPHTAQGRNLALVDGVELAEHTAHLLDKGPPPATALAAYERARKPPAEAMARLGDELVLFWNADNPLLTTLRDRVFKGLSGNRALRLRTMEEIGGLGGASLSPWERMRLLAGL